ncbi:flagellar hook-length control protein FliK [Brevundimonas sp. S30B]|nr:flagellar hook-length control protein FliK [Brevundimonas sp. MF30-B]TFW04600.1 flagellar hook-length control protein FliK [Brevundimonas sp. S30B]
MSRVAVETTAQIAAQIVRRLEGRSTRFDMVLTPEHLGRVDVKLDIDSEGRLAARLAFDNPAAATDLRGRADELRRQLQDAGFQLAHDALDFSEREAGSGQMFDQRRERASAFSARARLGAEDDPIQAPAWTPLSLTPRGVDLKV